MLSRREILTSSLTALTVHAGYSDSSSFWVFGLLKPTCLTLRSVASARLHCRSQRNVFILEAGQTALIDLTTSTFSACGPGGVPIAFELDIPNVLRRRYFGTLKIEIANGILIPIVTMPISAAVGSIVGAELPVARAPMESLLAQAVVARSFLQATKMPRHAPAFFCDTTHCQFLRSPALDGSRVSQAVHSSARLLLASGDAPFPASYSAACGGRTEGGERDGFLYTAVDCSTCRQSRFARRGHGWGLCQEGAMDLARQGMKGAAILAHYYPGSSLRYV